MVLSFLFSLSVDLKERDPGTSADATWALAQMGLTPSDVEVARSAEELEQLVHRVWKDDPLIVNPRH